MIYHEWDGKTMHKRKLAPFTMKELRINLSIHRNGKYVKSSNRCLRLVNAKWTLTEFMEKIEKLAKQLSGCPPDRKRAGTRIVQL